MKKPTIREYFGPNINDYVDREMNDVEFAQYQKDKAEAEAQIAEAEAKATAKAALLDRLGITEDEARLLLS